MTKEELIAKYPTLFRNVYCGFDSGDGWNGLIDKASYLILRFQDRLGEPTRFAQIKEKYGELRLYLDHANEKQTTIAGKFEFMSNYTCENCGTTQDVTKEGKWIKTLCKTCRGV